MTLTLDKRVSDYETFGEVFRDKRDELLELTLWRRNLHMLEKFLSSLAVQLQISINDIIGAWEDFVAVYNELSNSRLCSDIRGSSVVNIS